MRTFVTAIALTGTVAAGVSAIPAMAATRTVKATKQNTWSPKVLRAKKGDTVKFSWNTGAAHNLRKYAGKGPRVGTAINFKGKKTFKIPAKGTYKFICDVHADTMKMTIKAS